MVKVSSPQFEPYADPNKHVMMCHYKAKSDHKLGKGSYKKLAEKKKISRSEASKNETDEKKEERRKNETERKKIYRQKLKEKSDLNAKNNGKVGKKKGNNNN